MSKIYKIGGDITCNLEKIKSFFSIWEKDHEERKVLVVSAARGVTDLLINLEEEDLYNNLLKIHLRISEGLGLDLNKIEENLKEKLRDLGSNEHNVIVSLGERLMVEVIKEFFISRGIKIESITGYSLGILVKEDYIDKSCSNFVRDKIEKIFSKDSLPIVTGFEGVSEGKVGVLNRSGSDQTATFLAYCLDADAVHLIKNTRGVQTADPSIVKDARTISDLSYDMAMEAGNIQLESIRYVKEKKIPLCIQYIDEPKIKTKVTHDFSSENIELIAGIENCLFFEVREIRDQPGAEKEIIDLLDKYGVNKEISLDTRNSVAFVLNTGLDKVKFIKEELRNHTIVCKECSLILIIGNLDRTKIRLFEDVVLEICSPLSNASWINESIVASIIIPKKDYLKVILNSHNKLIKK